MHWRSSLAKTQDVYNDSYKLKETPVQSLICIAYALPEFFAIVLRAEPMKKKSESAYFFEVFSRVECPKSCWTSPKRD